MERMEEFCFEQVRFASSIGLSNEDNFPEGFYLESCGAGLGWKHGVWHHQ